jgi:preprotein translocase subunit SecG
MQTLLIVIHLMIVIALVTVVLMQRSEGGGLGIGGGGSNMMAARGTGNLLTKVTTGLAICFFATSLGLSLLARYGAQPIDILDRLPVEESQTIPGEGRGVLDQLGGDEVPAPPADGGATGEPQIPSGQ